MPCPEGRYQGLVTAYSRAGGTSDLAFVGKRFVHPTASALFSLLTLRMRPTCSGGYVG